MLASYRRSDDRSAEAGLKYFVLGALASGILLYGISLLYGFTGTMSFAGIAAAFARDGAQSLGLLFGLVFVLAGIAFKVSAVPFHMWTPDVYEGAPTPVTAFFASAPKVAAILLGDPRLPRGAGPGDRRVAADRHLRGARLDLPRRASPRIGQTNIKRLLAYSSINNVGFALVGLAAGGAGGRVVGAVLHGGLCRHDARRVPVRAVDARRGRRAGRGHRRACPACRRRRPAFAAALAIFMFSLAGIPPLFGFWPKLLVFNAAVEAGLLALAVAGIVGTVDRRLLLPEDRQDHVFRRARRADAAGARSRSKAR